VKCNSFSENPNSIYGTDTYLEEKVLDLLGHPPRFGSAFVFSRHRHSFKLVEITRKVELFRGVPNSRLMFDKHLVGFGNKEDGEKQEYRSICENKVGGGECVGEKHVVSGKEQDNWRANEQPPAGERLQPSLDWQKVAICEILSFQALAEPQVCAAGQ
jgi:hypothetical protein